MKTPLADYMKAHKLKDGDDIELESGESFQLQFDIDVSALNPSLDFHYQREVAVLANSDKTKTSWATIVEPSLVKVFGKNWEEKILSNGSKAAPELWVAAENVDAVEKPKEGKKQQTVPKFIALYEDEDACRAARDERYPPRDEEAEMAFGEDEADEADDEEGGITEEIIESVTSLHNANRKNIKQTRKMLETKPFGDFKPDELLKAAGIK